MSTNHELNTETDPTESTVTGEQQNNEQPPTQATEAVTAQSDPEQDTPDTNTEPEPQNTAQKAAQEAKKYRHRLREVETQRDALQTQVDNFAQTMLEHKLEQHTKIDNPNRPTGTVNIALKHTADFLHMTGKTASDYLTDDGAFNQERFEQTLSELYTARPELFYQKLHGPYIPNIGNPVKTAPQNQFSDAFKPENHR